MRDTESGATMARPRRYIVLSVSCGSLPSARRNAGAYFRSDRLRRQAERNSDDHATVSPYVAGTLKRPSNGDLRCHGRSSSRAMARRADVRRQFAEVRALGDQMDAAEWAIEG
jgi:hypothetical protein